MYYEVALEFAFLVALLTRPVSTQKVSSCENGLISNRCSGDGLLNCCMWRSPSITMSTTLESSSVMWRVWYDVFD